MSTRACSWQGYLGGARYQDAGCAGGRIVDLDDCERPGGPCGETGDQCPNCHGRGVVEEGHVDVGPMALIRQRAHDELTDRLDELAFTDDQNERLEYAAEIKTQHIGPLFDLVRQLEVGP